jgi:tRNA-specific 2-thiouridylase
MNKQEKKLRARPEPSRRVLVAMSGGVDSSVAAALLKKQGYDVIGVFMHFWADGGAGHEKVGENIRMNIRMHSNKNSNVCCSLEAYNDAKRVAQKLDIPLYTLNFDRPFKEAVVDYFLAEYQAGRTPNPCVACNKFIKFGLLLERAKKYGADYIATGHYVRTRKHTNIGRTNTNTRIVLLKAKDEHKDQSYFLYNLTQKKLAHLIFPIGDYTKDEVRTMAKKMGLPVHAKKDSQEVCFVNNDLKSFLDRWLKIRGGEVRDIKNKKILGRHEGLVFYTIGQRRGIGIGASKPYYVAKLDTRKNILWVTDNPEDKALYKKDLVAKQVSFVSGEPVLPLKVEVKIRSTAPFVAAVVSHKAGQNRYKVIFKKPERAVTPGQSVVFYRGEEVIGGGIII